MHIGGGGEMELVKVEWREKMCEVLSKIEDDEKLIGLRNLASVIKEMLRNDQRFISRLQLFLRCGDKNTVVDVYYDDILLGRIDLANDATIDALKSKLVESRMEFATELLVNLVTEFQYICASAHREDEPDDP
jgi:hypothetical protein